MGFGDRLTQANTTIEVVGKYIWNVEPSASRITAVAYGYETHIPANVRQNMRYIRTITAKHIRFTPDFFVIDRERQDPVYLLEYKVTQTPIFSRNRIDLIRVNSGNKNIDWPDIGQMEADAYDNYMSLHNSGVRVAILNYCAYHPRLLLCDFIEKVVLLHRDKVAVSRGGSGTPFINFDCNSMRSLDTFIFEEHGIKVNEDLYNSALYDLVDLLPITHHPSSPLYKKR